MDKKFIEKARVELREDDLRKSQALAQMRDWLAKHPYLKEIRQDDSYLLQFLRVKKFNVEEAFKTLERSYLSRKRYPQFTDHDVTRLEKLFKLGYCFPFPGRDSEGRKIILLQTGRLLVDEFTVYDAFKLFCYVVIVSMEEEETQVSGIVCIFNHENATLKHLPSPIDARDFMDFVKNCSTSRQKGNYVMNLPSYANFMIEIFKQLMSEKLNKRLFIIKNSDELKKHIDPSLLPIEFGGTKTEAQMLAEFLKFRDEKQDLLRQLFDFKVDWNKVPPEKFLSTDEHGTVGSFRKLEID